MGLAVVKPHGLLVVVVVVAVASVGRDTAVLVALVDQTLERMVVEWCRAIVADDSQTRAQQSTKARPYTWSMGKTMVADKTVVGNIDDDV